MKKPIKQNSIGKHWHIEIYACNILKLKTVPFVQQTLSEAASASGATIVNENFHQFSPFGVSGVVVIEESHFTIHTWPEHAYAAVDFFTCGDSIDIQKALDVIGNNFETEKIEVRYFDRGNIEKAKELMPEILKEENVKK